MQLSKTLKAKRPRVKKEIPILDRAIAKNPTPTCNKEMNVDLYIYIYIYNTRFDPRPNII